MPLLFVRDDITDLHVDAIVCPTDAYCSASGGTDAAIRQKGGLRLRAACRKLGTLQPGDVRRTDGYALPCRYIFHVYGPVWQGGDSGEVQTLADCYRKVLNYASDSGCESIAFPLLSAGSFGFSPDAALQTAVRAIRSSPYAQEMTVYLALYNESCAALAERYRFLRPRLTPDKPSPPAASLPARNLQKPSAPMRENFAQAKQKRATHDRSADEDVLLSEDIADAEYDSSSEDASDRMCGALRAESEACSFPASVLSAPSLEELLAQQDESFSEMLLRLIDEKGMTDAQCYKRANIDRKLFSKIRSNRTYKPSKATALAFAVALELPPAQARELLQKAGYAFSHSSKFDIIVEYFIEQGEYDIFTINEALFAYDQTLLC